MKPSPLARHHSDYLHKLTGGPCKEHGTNKPPPTMKLIRLLLERKVMTNLDSILKCRDITLPTKVYLVKALVFPVAMYGCESWTIKKAERQRIDAFELWC